MIWIRNFRSDERGNKMKDGTTCHYCGKYTNYEIPFIEETSGLYEFECEYCHRKFKIRTFVSREFVPIVEETKETINFQMVNEIKEVLNQFIGKVNSKLSRYHNTVVIDNKIYEKMNDDGYEISLYAKTYDEKRSVTFIVLPLNEVKYCVTSLDTWKQKCWWKGETLKERVNNYVTQSLLNWEVI